MITCGHDTQITGIEIGQPSLSEKVGVVNRVSYDSNDFTQFDAATIDLDSGVDVTYKIANDSKNSYKRRDIYGTISWDAIKDKEGDQSYDVNRQGTGSGVSSGYISKTYTSGTFKTTASNAAGDSGGPHYRRISDLSDYYYIFGTHNAGNGSESLATATAKVESTWPVEV